MMHAFVVCVNFVLTRIVKVETLSAVIGEASAQKVHTFFNKELK
jgi:hypothetical protein